MQVDYAKLRSQVEQVRAELSAVRSTRNLQSRRRNAEAHEDRVAETGRRRHKARRDREADAFLKRRIRVKVAVPDRPRNRSKTPRRLFHRAFEAMLKGSTGLTDSRGPDRLYSIHYAFTARGFASRKERRWREREAERAALYSVREDALEGGEAGWWSNVAADRNELAAHYRASEELEKHDRSNANVYCAEVIALPAELTPRQRRLAVRRICRWFDARGLAYTVGIHLPDHAGDQRNYHVHIIYSLRPCQRNGPYDWSFAVAKESDINTPEGILARRHAVVRAINATLHAARIDKRYTHLSNKARRMAPGQAKVGQKATWAARRLAAFESKAAKLEKLQDTVALVRQTIVDGAARLQATATVIAANLEATTISLRDSGPGRAGQPLVEPNAASSERHSNCRIVTERDRTHAALVERSAEISHAADHATARLNAAGVRADRIAGLLVLEERIVERAKRFDPRLERTAARVRQTLDAVAFGSEQNFTRLELVRAGASRRLDSIAELIAGAADPALLDELRSTVLDRLAVIAAEIAADMPHQRNTLAQLYAIRQEATGNRPTPGPKVTAARDLARSRALPNPGKALGFPSVHESAEVSEPYLLDNPSVRPIGGVGEPSIASEHDRHHEQISAAERNALLSAQLEDRKADAQRRLRIAAWRLLREQGTTVTESEDGRYAIDMNSLPSREHRALLDAAYAQELQKGLAAMFAQQAVAVVTPPGPEVAEHRASNPGESSVTRKELSASAMRDVIAESARKSGSPQTDQLPAANAGQPRSMAKGPNKIDQPESDPRGREPGADR